MASKKLKVKPAKRKTKAQSTRKPFFQAQPKPRNFKMNWEVNDANLTMDLHHLLTGTYFDEYGNQIKELHTPLAIYCNAYKGSFAIAYKSALIKYRNKFTMKSKVTAINEKTGQKLITYMEMYCDEEMSLLEFLYAESAEGHTFYIEESGIKTRWNGFFPELEKFLHSFGDDYELITNHCELTCTSSFYTNEHERVYRALELIHSSEDLNHKAA